MKIVTPLDNDFNFTECKKLYLENEKYMNNICCFEDLINKSHFFSFYKNGELAACIYMVSENDKVYINGYSVRKNHLFNMQAVKRICSFYSTPIFAKTKNKTAEVLLKKCGFKLLKTDSNGIKHLKKER